MQLLFNKILWVVFRQFDGLRLGEEADYEARNCLPALNPLANGHKASFNH